MKQVKLLVISLIAALTLVLTACSGGSTSSNNTDNSLNDVKNKGELVFATEGTYKPFSYNDGGSGLTGYDVDIAKAVAEKIGVTAKFEQTQFDGIFAGLEAKRFDVIANQISINPERQKKYDFSKPYTISTGVIVVKDSNDSIKSFDDLQGKTTAQTPTSNWFKLAQQSGANLESVEGWAQAVALVQQDRVDAAINDKLTYLDYMKNNPDAGLKIAAESPDTSQNAFVTRKGAQALTDALSKALDELAADGTLTQISMKYFGADVSK